MGNKIIIKQYTKQGKLVKVWESMSEAQRGTSTNNSSVNYRKENKILDK